MSKVDVIMPQMGESIAEGTLTRWLKQIGETVERDEDLFEISTDKVDADIPSPVAGTLVEILVALSIMGIAVGAGEYWNCSYGSESFLRRNLCHVSCFQVRCFGSVFDLPCFRAGVCKGGERFNRWAKS